MIRVRARGEEFRIVQMQGHLFVCSRENGNCCCGWEEKGRMPFDNSLWGGEWERRKIRNRIHLTFTGCLGPCAVGNSALLQILGRSIWFKDLNETALVPAIFDYAQSMLENGRILTPPENLKGHVYERFLTQEATGPVSLFDPVEDQEVADLDCLDPVCLMDVDPRSARHKVDYQGRVYLFCAPSCKKEFLADPGAYIAD